MRLYAAHRGAQAQNGLPRIGPLEGGKNGGGRPKDPGHTFDRISREFITRLLREWFRVVISIALDQYSFHEY